MTHTGELQTVVSALHNHQLPPRHFTVTAAPAHTEVRQKYKQGRENSHKCSACVTTRRLGWLLMSEVLGKSVGQTEGEWSGAE